MVKSSNFPQGRFHPTYRPTQHHWDMRFGQNWYTTLFVPREFILRGDSVLSPPPILVFNSQKGELRMLCPYFGRHIGDTLAKGKPQHMNLYPRESDNYWEIEDHLLLANLFFFFFFLTPSPSLLPRFPPSLDFLLPSFLLIHFFLFPLLLSFFLNCIYSYELHYALPMGAILNQGGKDQCLRGLKKYLTCMYRA